VCGNRRWVSVGRVEGQALLTISNAAETMNAFTDGTNSGTSTDVFLGAFPDSYEHTGVVSHQGYEFFKVCIMDSFNSVAHVQRHVEKYFGDMRALPRTHIDELIAFDKTLD
jgi:hypothetical protein